MDVLIILTATVNVNTNKDFLFQTDKTERINTYIKSVLSWLKNTTFNIVLIDNSGYEFNELHIEKYNYRHRFDVITFNESTLDEAQYLKNNKSKGASEIFAINYAYKYVTEHKYNIEHNPKKFFIIKVTARFFILELESYLKLFNLNGFDCLTQHNRDRCEMVGCHYKNFSDIFDIHLINENNQYDEHIERIWKMRTSRYSRVLVCKEFKIESTQRGGLNEKYDTI
uniref:Uncharacterized protein n=1 Tax=viral metagenome TaxID=1070528 RepID=A0A6C0JJN6_9ZZZZ